MFSTKLNNFLSKFNFSIIILLFLLSKIIIFLFFIRIHSNLNSYWQLSDLELLQFDLINTIKFLHMQQPLWNFLIGVLLKFANGNLEMLSITLLVYHWIISLLLLFILNFYCNKFNLSLIKKNIIFIIFIFHPSIIFYENLPFYAHTVVFLFSLMSVQLFMLFENKIINMKFIFI